VRHLRQEDDHVNVIWRAFELRPEPVPTLDPKGQYLQRVWRDSVCPLAERLHMTVKLPPVQPRSRLAHEAARWASESGQFDRYHAAVFKAFFERGEDIGKVDVLVGLARDLGLDGEALLAALRRRDYEAAVLADVRNSETLGIRAVPAFVANGRAILSGVQSVENLKELIADARADRSDGRIA
jgi:predicted DsbA family dithiol-disulfide isomerase